MELDQRAEVAQGIDQLAKLTIELGINLKSGQQLIIMSPDGALPTLVPHSSPISKSGILYYNTVLDENAASHIGFG